MLHVDPGEVVTGPGCSCCGRAGRSAFGFVHRGSIPIAFYYAWLDPHLERRTTSLAISIGDWSNAGDVSTRRAAALRFELMGEEIVGSFLEPESSPFGDRDLLGQFLSAGEIRESPSRGEFLDVAEVIVLEDPEVNAHLMR